MRNSVFLFIMTAICLVACTRPQEESTKLTLSLPLSSSALSKADQSSQSSGNNWGQSDPTSLSEIGCYAVFIGGPEVALSNKTCSVGSGSSFKTFKFGQGGGFYPAGSTITLETDPGAARQIYVLGVKKGSTFCESFDISSPDAINTANYSNPLLLGQATKDLTAGDNAVTVNVSLTNLTDQKIGNCNFYPDRAPLTNVKVEGPIATGGSAPQEFRLGGGICNKFFLRLQDGNGSGGGFNDTTRVVQWSKSGSGAAAVNLYPDQTCSAAVAYPYQLSIPAGEEEKEFYIKATGTLNPSDASFAIAAVSGFDASFTSISIPTLANSVASSTGQKPFFYDRSLNIPDGKCDDVEFAMLDASGYTAKVPAAGLSFRDLTDTVRTSTAQFVNSCSALTTISNVNSDATKSFGSIGIQMGGSAQKDMYAAMLISANIDRLLLNVTPTVSKLSLNYPTSTVFVGDCLNLGASAVNSSGSAEDFSGIDNSGFSIPKRALGNFYLNGLSGWNYYQYGTDSSCITGSPGIGYSPFTMINATPAFSNYFQILTEGSVTVSADAHPFAQGDSPKISINPLWSPYLFGGNLSEWLRLEDVNLSGGFLTAWYPKYYPTPVTTLPTATAGPNGPAMVTDTSLDGRKAVTYTNTDGQSFTVPLSLTNTASISFMVYVDSAGAAGRLMSTSYTGTEKMNLAVASGATAVSFDFLDSSGPQPIAYLSDMKDKWSVVTIVMSQSGTNKYSVYLNGSTLMFSNFDSTTSFNIDRIEFGDYVTSGSLSFKGKMTDVVVTNTALNTSDISKIYTYFKNRYPNANLP